VVEVAIFTDCNNREVDVRRIGAPLTYWAGGREHEYEPGDWLVFAANEAVNLWHDADFRKRFMPRNEAAKQLMTRQFAPVVREGRAIVWPDELIVGARYSFVMKKKSAICPSVAYIGRLTAVQNDKLEVDREADNGVVTLVHRELAYAIPWESDLSL